MKNEDPILYKGCNSALFSAIAVVASILGAGVIVIAAIIIEHL